MLELKYYYSLACIIVNQLRDNRIVNCVLYLLFACLIIFLPTWVSCCLVFHAIIPVQATSVRCLTSLLIVRIHLPCKRLNWRFSLHCVWKKYLKVFILPIFNYIVMLSKYCSIPCTIIYPTSSLAFAFWDLQSMAVSTNKIKVSSMCCMSSPTTTWIFEVVAKFRRLWMVLILKTFAPTTHNLTHMLAVITICQMTCGSPQECVYSVRGWYDRPRTPPR